MPLLGTEYIPEDHGGYHLSPEQWATVSIERAEPQHAFEPHLLYADQCRICERVESEHNGILKAVEYLKALIAAYREISPVLNRKAQYWWSLMNEREKVLAHGILTLTGTKVW